MSTAGDHAAHELVVAPDGSIPASQLSRLGLEPGTHLRVVDSERGEHAPLAGSLPAFPKLTWEDFERASDLARRKYDLLVRVVAGRVPLAG